MSRKDRRARSRGTGIALITAALCALGPVETATAQAPDFATQRLPVPVTAGALSFSGRRVSLWSEPGGGASRMVLTGDVRIALGMYTFDAARAAVWLSPLPDGDPERAPGVFQVFIYFDRVGTPRSDAAVSLTAERLAVQGVIRADAPPAIDADLRTDIPPSDGFTREAERKLAAYFARVAAGEPGGVDITTITSPDELAAAGARPPGEAARARRAAEADDIARRIDQARARLAPTRRDQPIFADNALLTIAAGDVTYTPAAEEGGEAVVTVSGDERNAVTFVIQQTNEKGEEQLLQLSAERGVLFVDAGEAPAVGQFPISNVRGIYLEGDVFAEQVTGGQTYSVRAPQVYYSTRDQRALLIDAVFWTTEEQRGLPLYVRAKSIEQLGENSFRATKARVTNTAFHDPGLAIGVSSVTIVKQEPAQEGEPRRTLVDARDITLKVGGLPVFYFPRFRGDPALIPIRELRFETNSSRGVAVKTAWNAYSLLGIEQPKGQEMSLLLDEYFERGPAVGLDWTWLGPETRGGLLAYTIPYDAGRDRTSTGQTVERSGETRVLVLAEHQARMSEHWRLQADGAYVSDATFPDAFFDQIARHRRELENSIHVRRTDHNTHFTGEIKGTFNDFIINEYLVQSQGYSVSRLPEATYTRLADDLLPNAAPGMLTYSSQTRVGRVAFAMDEETAEDRGFVTVRQAQAFFGILPGQSPADALRALGYMSRFVTRFDSRHEVSAQLNAGPFQVTPFVTGRFTTWDHDFTDVSPDADERYRFWGGAGARIGTAFQRVNNSVESRLLDLHRTRHIVEPSLTVLTSDTSIDREDLPIYDEGVESIAQGDMIRIAVDQTWQTYRGGPGRQRSVDVLKVDAELVFGDETGPGRSPIGRWIDYRPEASSIGDFAGFSAVWQASEVVALAGEIVYDFDASQPDRTVTGAVIQHSPDFSTWADLRFINSQEQTYATVGAQYQLTPKYGFEGWASYDTDRSDFQNIGVEVRRAMPNVWLGFGVSYNNINGDTSFSLVFQPRGVLGGGGGGTRSGFGAGAARSPLLGG